MSLMFGTVSYLPDNDVRQIRKERAIKTFKTYGELAKSCDKPLHIVTTNWSDLEWEELTLEFSDLGIELVRIPCTTLGCGFAKTLMYRYFYSTDCDYLFMGDDDIIIYPYYGFIECLRELDTVPQKFMDSKIGFFTCIRAAIIPYKEANLNDVDFCDNWVFTYKNINNLGHPFVICNTRKYFDIEVRPLYEGMSFGFREDMSFVAEVMKAGIIPYTLTSFIATTFSNAEFDSSIHCGKRTEQEELEYRKMLNDEFIRLYPRAYIDKAMNWMNVSPYLPNRFDQRVLVKRDKPYIFTDKDYPIKRGKKPRIGLFKK